MESNIFFEDDTAGERESPKAIKKKLQQKDKEMAAARYNEYVNKQLEEDEIKQVSTVPNTRQNLKNSTNLNGRTLKSLKESSEAKGFNVVDYDTQNFSNTNQVENRDQLRQIPPPYTRLGNHLEEEPPSNSPRRQQTSTLADVLRAKQNQGKSSREVKDSYQRTVDENISLQEQLLYNPKMSNSSKTGKDNVFPSSKENKTFNDFSLVAQMANPKATKEINDLEHTLMEMQLAKDMMQSELDGLTLTKSRTSKRKNLTIAERQRVKSLENRISGLDRDISSTKVHLREIYQYP